jgi:hypothetical protein
METFRFDGIANGIGMNVQLLGDGADFPVLGVKIAADLHACFGVNHGFPSTGVRADLRRSSALSSES